MAEEKVQTGIYDAGMVDEQAVLDLVKLVNDAYGRHRWLFPEERTNVTEFRREAAGKELVLLLSGPDEKIVGSALVHEEGDALYLEMVAVELLRQGVGLGARLMQAVEEIARQRSLSKIRLSTVREIGNVAYYLRHGFHIVQEQSLPRGTWGALDSFTLATMEKEAVRTNNDFSLPSPAMSS
jgi:N-acetylglutamate synthase-like GNAT family acetyltransferase